MVTSVNERQAEVSPDGQLMAYASQASGRFEVYWVEGLRRRVPPGD